MTSPDSDAIAAALIQIAAHAERISDLDTREAGHHREIASQLTGLAAQADTASTRIAAITGTLARHAAVVNSLGDLDRQVAALARQLADLTGTGEEPDGRGYQPAAARRWWHLTGSDRDAAISLLRAWIDQIYQPGYGHFAAILPPCWEHHPVCLYTLDWLSELWSVLYIQPRRTHGALAAQAEWQTRLLPAAASQMAREASSCQHLPGSVRRPPDARASASPSSPGASPGRISRPPGSPPHGGP